MSTGPTSLRRQPRLVGYLVAEAISAIGSWALVIALWGVAAYRFDVGAGGATVIGLTWTVPAVLLGPLVGVLIDRHGARRVLIAADLAAGGAALAMALADSFLSLVLLSTLHGMAWAAVQPSILALSARLVGPGDLARFSALVRSTTSLAIVVGPAVGAAAIAAWGFGAAFLVDAASYASGWREPSPFVPGRWPVRPRHPGLRTRTAPAASTRPPPACAWPARAPSCVGC